MKKKRIWVYLVITIGCCLLVPVLFLKCSFRELDKDLHMKSILTDESGIVYYLTQDGCLYVGGEHNDSFGLYETNFRWSFLYGIRKNVFGWDDPVMFDQNVDAVFPGSGGFAFRKADGQLYYFGNYGKNSEVQLIAQQVRFAKLNHGVLTYVDQDDNAYLVYSDVGARGGWSRPELIERNVAQIHAGAGYNVILFEDGELYITMPDKRTAERELVDHDVKNLFVFEPSVFYQTNDGLVHQLWLDIFNTNPEYSQILSLATEAIFPIDSTTIACSMSDGRLIVVDDLRPKEIQLQTSGKATGLRQGTVYEVDMQSAYSGAMLEIVSGSSAELFFVYKDGSYEIKTFRN